MNFFPEITEKFVFDYNDISRYKQSLEFMKDFVLLPEKRAKRQVADADDDTIFTTENVDATLAPKEPNYVRRRVIKNWKKELEKIFRNF